MQPTDDYLAASVQQDSWHNAILSLKLPWHARPLYALYQQVTAVLAPTPPVPAAVAAAAHADIVHKSHRRTKRLQGDMDGSEAPSTKKHKPSKSAWNRIDADLAVDIEEARAAHPRAAELVNQLLQADRFVLHLC